MGCHYCEQFRREDEYFEADCGGCRLPQLKPENCQALELYCVLASPFVRDFSAWPLVLEIFGLKLSREEARKLLAKLILIHDLLTKKGS